ncbi:putative biofilm stress and motility protein A [Klebsiella michiganensis]|uniref:Putative biofilm stress and motility protein A n=1 Tax=Klebsiella michiganensis TaxID=1134687 RepID=A0A7H4PQX0_9ENTR|nr:putative biofilm stress and motility protein A [Klebsiella michiganensis]
MVMRRFAPWLMAIALTGCSALQGTPKAPPPATDHPQEIQRNQTAGLQKMGDGERINVRLTDGCRGCAKGQS